MCNKRRQSNYGGGGYTAGIDGCEYMQMLPADVEKQYPDYSLYPQYKEAYGFLTRGCPRDCSFCIVSQKEGRKSIQVADLHDFWRHQKTIKLLDPNLLACADHERLLVQLAESGAWVDYTQGLDVRLLDRDVIQLLNQVKCKNIHFAWDNPSEDLTKQFELFNKYSTNQDPRKKSVYVLTNHNSTHEQDLYRIYRLKELGYTPYIMIYEKQAAPRITRHLARWVNNKQLFRSVERFEDYDHKIA